MTLWPAVQARAQAELDTVLGQSFTRLPTIADRTRLPYTTALVIEILRWNPAAPLGLAHRLTQDDVYRGYRIPKGTIVWASIWYIWLYDDSEMATRVDKVTDIGRCCKIQKSSQTHRSSGQNVTLLRIELYVCSSGMRTHLSLLSVLDVGKCILSYRVHRRTRETRAHR